MRRSVFAAWALAFAAGADAFMPAGAPARLGLRPVAAVSVKGAHAAGCACGACGSLVRSKRAPALTMVGGRGAGEVAEKTGVGMDSGTYAQSLDTLFPGAVDEATYIEAMSRVVSGG